MKFPKIVIITRRKTYVFSDKNTALAYQKARKELARLHDEFNKEAN